VVRSTYRSGQASAVDTKEETCEVFLFNEEHVRRAREGMLEDVVVQEAAETFKMLANPTRVRLIRALANEELCVCDLSEVLGLSVSATSHQLQLLRKMRLVRARTQGKLVYYSLCDRFVFTMLEDCLRHMKGQEE
jgi:DNA-binding transcriptional ArsR family regulator